MLRKKKKNPSELYRSGYVLRVASDGGVVDLRTAACGAANREGGNRGCRGEKSIMQSESFLNRGWSSAAGGAVGWRHGPHRNSLETNPRAWVIDVLGE